MVSFIEAKHIKVISKQDPKINIQLEEGWAWSMSKLKMFTIHGILMERDL